MRPAKPALQSGPTTRRCTTRWAWRGAGPPPGRRGVPPWSGRWRSTPPTRCAVGRSASLRAARAPGGRRARAGPGSWPTWTRPRRRSTCTPSWTPTPRRPRWRPATRCRTPASMPAELRYHGPRAPLPPAASTRREGRLPGPASTPPLRSRARTTRSRRSTRSPIGGDRALAHAEAYARLEPTSGFAHARLASFCRCAGGWPKRGGPARGAPPRHRRRAGVATTLNHMLCDTEEDGAVSSAPVPSHGGARAPAAAPAGAPPRPRRPDPRRVSLGRASASRLRRTSSIRSCRARPIACRGVSLETRRSPSARDLEALASLGDHTRAVGRLSDDALLAWSTPMASTSWSSRQPFPVQPVGAPGAAGRRPCRRRCPLPGHDGCRRGRLLLTDRLPARVAPSTSTRAGAPPARRLPGLRAAAVCAPWRPSPASRKRVRHVRADPQLMKIGADVWDSVAAGSCDARVTAPATTPMASWRGRRVRRVPFCDGSSRHAPSIRRGCGSSASGRTASILALLARSHRPRHLAVHGTTTTCECLWMVVPVITRTGGTHASRVSGVCCARAGSPSWWPAIPSGYVAIATALAADPLAFVPTASRCGQARHCPRTDGRAGAGRGAGRRPTRTGWRRAQVQPAARRSRGGSAGNDLLADAAVPAICTGPALLEAHSTSRRSSA